uniref:endoplasmic reticulum-Golgi intermediate compartment protein 2-like n=1 Tax=Styela clava TaxID=7725 RepID=UPI00193A18FA|nr:endoplasmic reticulum-Golgi intermediate compartment protein 2-like [Styela clava]
MLRHRGPRTVLTTVKELDAFPKIPESYSETSARGGAISICTFLLIFILVISEVGFFLDTRLKFKYQVDVEYNEKVWLNFDITVASDCRLIGADVVDVTGQAWVFTEEIREKQVNFELSPEESFLRDSLLKKKAVLLDEDDGTKISEIAIKHGFNATQIYFQAEKDSSLGPFDACRFYGNVLVNKVSGNFHIVAGKSIPLRGGHAHLSFLANNVNYNFSHRINHFSFGDMKVGFINVLDGDEHLTNVQGATFQYYINAVATHISSRRFNTNTYQFSVSEQSTLTDNSMGIAGIFFKYSFSPIAVKIQEQSMPLGRFFVRLCGIVGGIFATSHIINILIGIVSDYTKQKRTDLSSKTNAATLKTATLLSDSAPVNNSVS